MTTMLDINIGNDWDDFLQNEAAQPYFCDLMQFLAAEYAEKTIFPPKNEVFSALRHTSYSGTKVVILGQDPYIQHGQAHGMAFGVMPTAKIPPSLRNIFTELANDLGCQRPLTGDLTAWATQGVLLLNTALTVRAGQSKSHAGKGWERLTDNIITWLNQRERPVVFMLWGNDAIAKSKLITNGKHLHLVLTAAHPSPLARGKFFGCKHFSQANAFLEKHGQAAIDWQL